jgi:polysaccharide deacetylase family protein (PEP-CTERM system associated)
MMNLLTFDIEEWFRANYRGLAGPVVTERDERLEVNIQKLLDLCSRQGARATFFILGATAERHPNIVAWIKERGHEIASHGYRHALVYEQTPESFARDLRRSLDTLEGMAQEKIFGYRAPSWSITADLGWFFDILKKNGLTYDSSLFPAKTFLYGDRRAERFPHRVGEITEIPASTLSLLGKRIPFASGFFFRLFSYSFIRMGIKILNRRSQPAMICLHPREIDVSAPRLELRPKERFIHYLHIKSTERKLDRLLATFHFCSIRDRLSR